MRLLWLMSLMVFVACGLNEPSSPAGEPQAAPAPSPAAASGASREVPRAATETAPPPSVVDAGAPSVPSVEDNFPKWVLETTGPMRPKLAQCYVVGLAKEAGMAGIVMVAVGIDRDGKMTALPRPNRTVAPSVVACVVAHLVKARFAPPPGQAPITFTLPLSFRNNAKDGATVTVGNYDPGY